MVLNKSTNKEHLFLVPHRRIKSAAVKKLFEMVSSRQECEKKTRQKKQDKTHQIGICHLMCKYFFPIFTHLGLYAFIKTTAYICIFKYRQQFDSMSQNPFLDLPASLLTLPTSTFFKSPCGTCQMSFYNFAFGRVPGPRVKWMMGRKWAPGP